MHLPVVLEFVLFAASTAAFQATRLGCGLIAAAVLTPSEYGLWGLFLAMLGYTVYANLGLLSGANREIPILVGSGRASDADQVERSAYGGTIVVAGSLLIVVTIFAFVRPLSPWLAATFGAALALQQFYLLGQVVLRSQLRFNAASIQQLVLAIAFPLVALPLLPKLHVAALVAGQTLAYALGFAVVLLLWRRDLRPDFSPHLIANLAKAGLAIMGGGLIFAVLTTVDRWMTLLLLGAGALGQYTVAALLASGMLLLAQVVSQQFYPRMAMAYGRPVSGRELLRMAVRQSEVVFALLAPVVVVIALVGPWAISIWLGNYAAGIPALLTLLAAYLVLLCGTGFWNLLIVVGRANLYAACQAAAILVQVPASFVFVQLGWGLMGIAMAAATSFACLTGAGAVAAVRATR